MRVRTERRSEVTKDMSAGPLFTVQQVELIRRLRNSGLSKEQIVQAFESLDEVDAQLGNVYTVPVSFARYNRAAATTEHQTLQVTSATTSANDRLAGLVVPTTLQTTGSRAAPSAVHVNRRFPVVRRLKEVKVEREEGGEEGGAGTVSAQAGADGVTQDTGSSSVAEYLKQGSDKMQEDSRYYLFANPTLVHNEVAEAAGGGGLQVASGLEFKGEDCSAGFCGPGEAEGLVMNFTPRRERFTFRSQHLAVLEACFKKKQYPTLEERHDIAQRCNDAMEMVSGRTLGEKEQMTPQNVAYWFSNRRKDIKRMAREGGMDLTSVVLPSRVTHPMPAFTLLATDTATLTPRCGPQMLVTNGSPLTPLTAGTATTSSATPDSAGKGTATTTTTFPADLDRTRETPSGATETADLILQPQTAVSTVGAGSVVERIAAAITSQLASKVVDVETLPAIVTATSQSLAADVVGGNVKTKM